MHPNLLSQPQRFHGWRRAVRAALLLLGVAALVLLPIRAGTVLADGDYTDITGNPLQVHVRFPDKDTGSMIEVPIPTTGLSPQAQQLLGAPLNQWFDQYWSSTPDRNGQTMRDRSCEGAKTATGKAIADATGQTAHDISCNFATNGALRARVAGSELVLSYQLPGNVITFYVTTPDICVLVCVGAPGGADPKFSVTFDVELVVEIDVPAAPCALVTKGAAVLTHNASIDSGNLTADLIKDVDSIIRYDGGAGIFPPAQDRINREAQPIKLDLGSYLGQLTASCDAARGQGFQQFDAVVDTGRGILTFRLSHALDDAPLLHDPAADTTIVGSLNPPTVGSSQSQVRAGNQLNLTGAYFHGAATTHLHIDWSNGTASGQLVGSDIQWGPQGSPGTLTTKPRQNYDAQNFFDANNLTPNTTYQFRVRDCDQVTCTPWSALLTLKTTAQGSDLVTIYLDSETPANNIGSTTLLPDGTFSISVTIPGNAAPGPHTVYAAVADASKPVLSVPARVPAASVGNAGNAPAPRPTGSNSSVVLVNPNLNPTPAPGGRGSNVTNTTVVNPGLNSASPAANEQVATTTITVLGNSQALKPTITVIDPDTNAVQPSVMELYNFTLRGEGFVPGQVSISLDSAGGRAIGTTTAGSDGTFTALFKMLSGAYGDHTLVASETASGQTIQTTTSVYIQSIPR